ncbi:hypothetical protein AAVH_38663, partial [Aphelenchoides avenae]
MQADLPYNLLLRETMASLGPGARDSTLDDLAAWIRQLEELCDTKDAELAPANFCIDINGSCLSTFTAFGNKPSTATRTIKLQTKAVKGYPPLPELRMEKMSCKKKNARGEAKLRLSVPVLVLLTITDLHGASRMLRAVTEDDKALVPIKHPATTIEVTAVPLAPDQLLERLRLIVTQIKPNPEQNAQPSVSQQRSVAEAPAQRPADGVKYSTKRIGGQVIEQIFDPKTGTLTKKSSGCSNPHCDEVNCTAAPVTITWNVKTGETGYTTDDPLMNAVLGPMLKSSRENPRRQIDLCKRLATTLKEEEAIMERLPTAKPTEKKRLTKELESKKAEIANLKDLMLRTAG